jgi:hypothetical protein
VWGIREVRAGFCCGNLGERDHLEVLGIDERKILTSIIRKLGVGVWTGLIWLEIGTGGDLLRTL